MKKLLKILPALLIFITVILFFQQFLFKGMLPMPSDTIIGLYHPFRDLYAKDYPNGIPFKNFLITDPVRQTYPWRDLSISMEKNFRLPLWNPYNFSGLPLMANQQSAPFYPLNILLLLLPLSTGWGILILLQPLLGGIFLYLYLNNLKLNKWAGFLGAFIFSFSGFSVAWMEWGTVIHTAIWLPLILLSIDKVFENFRFSKISNFKFQISNFFWPFLFIFSLISSLFAGHLQTFFYVFVVSTFYFFIRWYQNNKNRRMLIIFAFCFLLFAVITAIQWIPTLQFILNSARDVDQLNWQKEGWFIPWQNLVQFLAPDFFGNPATLNYWGVWNYAEFIGYVGILPLILSFFALFFRHDKKTFFFGSVFFIALIFSLPTFIAKLPFILNIPLISTAQPTRLLFLADFSLAVLAALGFDYLFRERKKVIYPIIFLTFLFGGIWIFVIFSKQTLPFISFENISVAKRNLIFPTGVFLLSSFLLLTLMFLPKKHKIVSLMIYIILMAVTILDLMRFGLKFTPFTNKEYLFPETEITSFLKQNVGFYRIMATDSRILPPNFSIIYRLQSIDGYDPLYLRRYGELIASSERKTADITPPFGFNRIITPHNYQSKIINLLGVKYILSLTDVQSPSLKKVFQEGQTRVYENKNVLPRVFFVKNISQTKAKEDSIKEMFREDFNPIELAVVENISQIPQLQIGKAEITEYSENKVIIKTENNGEGFLVFTDSFYPTWRARVDGVETKIYNTDYNFRGIMVPSGKHKVEFYVNLF